MDQQIRTGKSMNVLGVIFDSKLDWHEQVANTIKKANKSLYAIKMIRNYFTPKEIKIFLDSFFTPFYIITQKSGCCQLLINVKNNYYSLHQLMP